MDKILVFVILFIAVCYIGGTIDLEQRKDVRNQAFQQSQTMLHYQDSVIGRYVVSDQKLKDSLSFFKGRNTFVFDSLKTRKVWTPKKDTLSIKHDTLK